MRRQKRKRRHDPHKISDHSETCHSLLPREPIGSILTLTLNTFFPIFFYTAVNAGVESSTFFSIEDEDSSKQHKKHGAD